MAAKGAPQDFSEAEKRGVYRAIYERRDVRSEFLPDPVPVETLGRLLDAAHHAPSVGFMQPWDFLIIEDPVVRRKVYDNFQTANARAGEIYNGERRERYNRLKLAGILDAPINLCVTCDRTRQYGYGLGRQTDPATDLYSTVCAVENLWLAARAESLGIGWVSILDFDELRAILGIPAHATPVAYLCVGYVSEFRPRPDLEDLGWERRGSLQDMIHFDQWGARDRTRSQELLRASAPIPEGAR
ncbi:MAG: 5,6-dimethylbenzimidazole synthase [Acidobacteriia bacterium]|nr:5,6-dimethylbenzimidazole synthase [Terriglobia bacterium]